MTFSKVATRDLDNVKSSSVRAGTSKTTLLGKQADVNLGVLPTSIDNYFPLF
jgi:hypothetical protein